MDEQTLVRLYRDMLRIRLVEERIAELYREQEMRCPVHLCIGQEAVAAGVCAVLEPQDQVMSAHRSHGHYLARGGSLAAMLAELYGKATGCAGGKGGSMHLVDLSVNFLGAAPIVGGTIPIAVGAAFAAAMRGEASVTVVFFGEGATEEGIFHESLSFAALKRLPVVFACENNLYSVYSPLSVRQPEGREVSRLAEAHGVPSLQGDGNDVVAVHRLAEIAVQRARAGEGPTCLELATYRWREHCGASYDNHIGYRTQEEFEAWKARCPIGRLGRVLLEEAVLSPAEAEVMAAAIGAEVEEAVRFAKESPFPSPSLARAHVYAEGRA